MFFCPQEEGESFPRRAVGIYESVCKMYIGEDHSPPPPPTPGHKGDFVSPLKEGISPIEEALVPTSLAPCLPSGENRPRELTVGSTLASEGDTVLSVTFALFELIRLDKAK